MLVSNNAGYKVFCETKHIEALPGHYHIRIYSTYDHSIDPVFQQTKLDMIVSSVELEYLLLSLNPNS
jgi:hypothetical protein